MSELPPSWATARLDEVAEVKLGRQRSPKDHFGDRMRPYLRAANVTWSGLDLSDVKDMNFTEQESKVFELQPGDVLVAEASGSASGVGKPALWRGEIPGCCFQNTLLRVRSPELHSRYLLHLLQTEALSGRLGNAARGVGIHHLGAARLSSWTIGIAPLAEQERIAAAIEEHFSRVDAAESSLRSARMRIQALHRPVLSLAVGSGGTARLGDLLVAIEAGKSFKCHGRPAEPGEWGVIKVSAMTWGFFDENANKAVLSERDADARWEINSGDLLLSRANTTDYVGATVLVDRCRPRLLLSDKSMRLIVREGIDKRWLHAALSAPESRSQMSAVATGTSDSMRNISQEKVRAVRLRVPTLREQREIIGSIERHLTLIHSLIAEVDAALQRSKSLRRSILEQAFAGKLVPQDPADEPASVLLERIAAERAAAAPVRRTDRGRPRRAATPGSPR